MDDNPTTVRQDARVVIAAIGFRLFKEGRVGKDDAGAIKFAEGGMAFGDKIRKKGNEKIAPIGTEVKRFASYITLDRIATGAFFRTVKVDYKVCVCVCVCVIEFCSFIVRKTGPTKKRRKPKREKSSPK